MASQEIRRKANIGSSPLIVIFIVLCLATFSLLSLGNAKSDSLLSERNGDAVKEYYRADSLGNEFLRQLDTSIRQAAASARGGDLKALVTEEWKDYYDRQEDVFLTEIAMHAGQALQIRVQADWAEGTCRILTWKVYNREEYEIDQSMKVWDGQM